MAKKKEEGAVDDDGTTVKMRATKDQSAVTIGDDEYTVDDDGTLDVAAEHELAFKAHGFERVPEKRGK